MKNVIIDGVKYVPFEEKKEEPKFKVGDWIIGKLDYYPEYPCRIIKLENDGVVFIGEDGCEMWEHTMIRLATKEEIEKHLRIKGDEYIGKRAKCLSDDCFYTPTTFYELTEWKRLWYNTKEGTVISLYYDGEWATIISKELPKTVEELETLFSNYAKYDYKDFLKSEGYDI